MRAFRAALPKPKLSESERASLHGALDFEIGAGQGLHAIRFCQSHPDRRLIAVERTHTKFNKLKRRLENHPDLSNLTGLHADALAVLTHEFKDESLERIFLLYPNPYPKNKQANLRWHLSPAMELIKSKLKSGGELHLATNLEWYAEEAKHHLQEQWGFRLKSEARLSDPHRARTHFEQKYLQRGETCFDFRFEKP
jgi:tRNA G46 methylase TrmB